MEPWIQITFNTGLYELETTCPMANQSVNNMISLNLVG